MVVWGGENPSKFDTGALYDPATDSWVGTTSTTGAPSARSHMKGVWTGREMIIWGGGSGGPHLNSGARYNPATDTWSGPTPTAGSPTGRASFAMVWTGSRMIVWGGDQDGTLVNTGGIYQPPIPAVGPHTSTISISAPGANNSPQTIAIDLTVNP